MDSDEVNVEYSEVLHKERICLTAPCLKFLSRKLNILPGLNILKNGRSSDPETWKMEEFLTLTKEHSLVTKGRALGATGYVAVCAFFCFLVNHKLKCHFHLFMLLLSH